METSGVIRNDFEVESDFCTWLKERFWYVFQDFNIVTIILQLEFYWGKQVTKKLCPQYRALTRQLSYESQVLSSFCAVWARPTKGGQGRVLAILLACNQGHLLCVTLHRMYFRLSFAFAFSNIQPQSEAWLKKIVRDYVKLLLT